MNNKKSTYFITKEKIENCQDTIKISHLLESSTDQSMYTER
jgi:hypothetical protein